MSVSHRARTQPMAGNRKSSCCDINLTTPIVGTQRHKLLSDDETEAVSEAAFRAVVVSGRSELVACSGIPQTEKTLTGTVSPLSDVGAAAFLTDSAPRWMLTVSLPSGTIVRVGL